MSFDARKGVEEIGTSAIFREGRKECTGIWYDPSVAKKIARLSKKRALSVGIFNVVSNKIRHHAPAIKDPEELEHVIMTRLQTRIRENARCNASFRIECRKREFKPL